MGGEVGMKKAVCLLSGGLDSTVTAAWAKSKGYQVHALTFDYGQRHKREIQSARKVAKALGTKEHRILRIDLAQIGGSALTDRRINVPKGKSYSQIKASKRIPVTYVPARNTILLSFALAYAEVVGADAIFIGANHMDYSGYPDCRPRYFRAYQRMANLATKSAVEGSKVRIEHPIIGMDKKAIVKAGIRLKAPLHLTWSCYSGGKKACGRCDSCVLRLNGFKEAQVKDPIEYESQ
jgi:7-cyano-7-deazaguanine synthase